METMQQAEEGPFPELTHPRRNLLALQWQVVAHLGKKLNCCNVLVWTQENCSSSAVTVLISQATTFIVNK